MLLVTWRPRLGLALLCCAGCREAPGGTKPVPSPTRSEVAAPSAPSAAAPRQPPAASASGPSSSFGNSPGEALERFHQGFAWSLDTTCADPRLVLAVDYPSAKANQAWLDELLLVAPELAARFQPGTATYLYRALYGGKRFRPAEPGEIADPTKQAVIARCGDVAACRTLAGAYAWLRPTNSSQLFCGMPPPTTSSEQPLDTPTPPTKRDATTTRVCARYRACVLVLPAPPSVAPSCDGLPTTAAKCLDLPACPEVRSCIDSIERQAHRPFREAQPRRVAGNAPRVGF